MQPDKSYSRAQRFLRCPYSYDLYYNRGIRAVVKAAPLKMGSLVDAGLCALILNESPEAGRIALHAAAQESMDQMCAFVIECPDLWDTPIGLDEYSAQLSEDTEKAWELVLRGAEYLGFPTEHDGPSDTWETAVVDGVPAVQLKLVTEGILSYLDWVAIEKATGRSWLFEFKVRKSLTSEIDDDFDGQKLVYLAQLRARGFEPSGTRVLEIRNELPKAPKVNKNGSISRAACATTWEIYKSMIIQHGGNPDDYEVMREKLEAREWVRDIYNFRAETEMMEGLANVHKVDALAKSTEVYPRNMSKWSCKGCDVRDYCWSEMRGHDADALIGSTFHKRK